MNLKLYKMPVLVIGALALAEVPYTGLVFMVLFIAWFLREMIERFIAPFFDNIGVMAKFKWLQIYVAFLLAVGVSFYFKLDLVFIVAGYTQVNWNTFTDVSWVGMLLTGAGIGAGANFIHLLIEFVAEQWTALKKLLIKPTS